MTRNVPEASSRCNRAIILDQVRLLHCAEGMTLLSMMQMVLAR